MKNLMFILILTASTANSASANLVAVSCEGQSGLGSHGCYLAPVRTGDSMQQGERQAAAPTGGIIGGPGVPTGAPKTGPK